MNEIDEIGYHAGRTLYVHDVADVIKGKVVKDFCQGNLIFIDGSALHALSDYYYAYYPETRRTITLYMVGRHEYGDYGIYAFSEEDARAAARFMNFINEEEPGPYPVYVTYTPLRVITRDFSAYELSKLFVFDRGTIIDFLNSIHEPEYTLLDYLADKR